MQTGFQSPAQGYEEKPIDLNALLIKRPSATYLMEMTNKALEGVGIYPGDYLIVDMSGRPKQGAVVIAEYQGEHIARVVKKNSFGILQLIGQGVKPIDLTDDVHIIAVVPYSIRKLQ